MKAKNVFGKQNGIILRMKKKKNPKDDIQDPQSPTQSSYGPQKPGNIQTGILTAIPTVFPVTLIGLLFKHENKR